MAMATALYEAEADQTGLMVAAFQALWVEGHDLEADKTLSQLSAQSGCQPLSEEGEVTALGQLTINTKKAYEKGVFGVPTFRINGDIYFGADRGDLLCWELGRQSGER